jgi:hypothetical protein
MDKNAFYKYVESRGQSGYGAALLVKEPGATLYSLLIASTSVGAVSGGSDSFEFDLLNSPSKGKIMGKSSLEDKEVEFLLHRDNVYRLEQLKDKTLDFMYFTPDFMGWKFNGTIKYRPNDAGADVLMGTYVISPMSADETPIFDVSSLIQETLCFSNSIPDTIVKNATQKFELVQSVTATFTVSKYDASTGKWESDNTITVLNGSATFSAVGLYAIKASANGYAPWTTTIRVVES